MSPRSKNDFVKKAFMAQKTQELGVPSASLRQGLNLKQKIQEMRQIQNKSRAIGQYGQNVDIKDLINGKMKESSHIRAGSIGRKDPAARRSSSSTSSKEEALFYQEKAAALKRTQHCFQKDGDAYKGLLYVQ